MAIDVVATAPHYVDHLLPIWEALPAAERRHFYVGPHARRDGIPGMRTVDLLGRDTRVPTLTVAHGDFKLARAAGRRRLALGQHGAGQSYATNHPSYPGGRDQEEASLFLVPNSFAADRTIAAYPKARVEIVGCPKLDHLPRKPRGAGRPVVAFSFHFDTAVALETRSAWPAYRAWLPVLARTHKVIGHAHPRFVRILGPWYRANRIELVPSLEDVFRRADVYACDNSSSMFEFAATGRPVVVLNAPWYRRKVSLGGRFWDWADIGINVERGPGLAGAIDRALEDPAEVRAARTATLGLIYQPRRGAAKLAARVLLDWAA